MGFIFLKPLARLSLTGLACRAIRYPSVDSLPICWLEDHLRRHLPKAETLAFFLPHHLTPTPPPGPFPSPDLQIRRGVRGEG